MTQPKKSPNLRDSFRFAVDENRRHSALRVGSEVLPATLLDESAGGFAIMVDRLDGLEVGQTVELCTDAGHHIVRVISVREIDLPKDESAAPENPTTQYRLGLSRLDEVVLPEQPAVSLWSRGLRFSLSQWYGSNGTPLAVNLLLVAVVMAAPLGFVIVLWYFGQGGVRPSAESNTSTWSGASPRISLPAILPESASKGARPNSDEFQPTASPFSNSAQRTAQPYSPPSRELQQMVRRLPGVTALTLPEVASRLQLTEEQRKQIRLVLDSVVQSAGELERKSPGKQRQEISQLRRRLYDEALQKSLNILTSQQRTEWQNLTAGQPSPPQGN